MMSKFFVLAAVALSSYQALAGDAAINVENGDGHVDNKLVGAHGGIADLARLHHDKIHTGHALSEQHAETEFGDWHHNDVGLGQHENLFHETYDGEDEHDGWHHHEGHHEGHDGHHGDFETPFDHGHH